MPPELVPVSTKSPGTSSSKARAARRTDSLRRARETMPPEGVLKHEREGCELAARPGTGADAWSSRLGLPSRLLDCIRMDWRGLRTELSCSPSR